ncbi:hypothetical protein JOF41_006201 [Saccharothrix coeruleofusca]|nr:hypothetical protein [Saccharothrix coeruleofusca]
MWLHVSLVTLGALAFVTRTVRVLRSHQKATPDSDSNETTSSA